MGLVIDTGLFIWAERNDVSDPMAMFPADEDLALSIITVSELYEGVRWAKSPRRAKKRSEFIEQFALTLPVVDFTLPIARVHAKIRATQRQRGKMIGAHDLIIAATAISMDWEVLTLNGAEFRQVEGLGVRDG